MMNERAQDFVQKVERELVHSGNRSLDESRYGAYQAMKLLGHQIAELVEAGSTGNDIRRFTDEVFRNYRPL